MRLVNTLCGKYKGVLPSCDVTKAYESDLNNQIHGNLRELGGEFAACQETYSLLLFSKHFIFNGNTLRLYASNVPVESGLVCVAVFDMSHAGDLSFECIHLISRTQWQKATIADSYYKSFSLKHLLTIRLGDRNVPSSPSSSTSSDDVMTMQIERSKLTHSSVNIEADAAQEYTDFQPFWLATQFHRLIDFSITKDNNEEEETSTSEEEERTSYLENYVQFTIDVCLFQRCFVKQTALKKKMMLYYQRMIAGHHHDVMFLFIAQMVQRSSKQKTYQAHMHHKEANLGETLAHLIEADWHREWLAAELFLFHACQWHSVLQASGNERLREHVAFMRARVPEVFWSNWYAYEENSVYWRLEENGLFRVKAEWLYQEEFAAIVASQPFIRGFAYLTSEIFTRLFMPTVYRLLMEDTFRYLFLVYQKGSEFCLERGDIDALRVSYRYSEADCYDVHEALKKFKLTNALGLYDCVASAGNISTPVIRKWFKTRPEFDLSSKRGDMAIDGDARRIAYQYKQPIRETMPDIEDLVNALPACMRQSMVTRATPFKMGNTDRVNLMRPMIDLGYGREEAVGYFARRAAPNNEYAPYVSDMNTTYDYFAGIHHTQAALTGINCQSFGCTSLINVRPDNKNGFTCFYAQRERLKEPGKTRFDWEDKKRFMNECAATLNRPLPDGVYLQHPVQYVLHQLNK